MIVTMTLELSDKPGELLSALEPVSDNGGNIVSVTHQRGEVTPRGTLPVEITFEIVEERLQKVLDSLREMGIRVAKFGEEKFHESMTVVLVGHLVRTDVTDTIQSVESEGVKIVDFSLAMPDEVEETSSARLVVNATCQDKLEQAVETIDEVCERKDLVKMQPIGVV
ncbi:MAG: amino acid-binding protein [Halobacteriales archaeon]|nr:amino acid-binding protein [Halobacteriales archaeon]